MGLHAAGQVARCLGAVFGAPPPSAVVATALMLRTAGTREIAANSPEYPGSSLDHRVWPGAGGGVQSLRSGFSQPGV